MRLTVALLKRLSPNGNIWLGKHRLAHHVYPNNIEGMVKRLKIEENNLLLLRYPYMTLEEERQEKALDKIGAQRRQEKLEYASSRTRYSRTFEDQYNHLKNGEHWEV